MLSHKTIKDQTIYRRNYDFWKNTQTSPVSWAVKYTDYIFAEG